MDRVRVISGRAFDFGKPYVAPTDPNASPDTGYDPFNGGGSPG